MINERIGGYWRGVGRGSSGESVVRPGFGKGAVNFLGMSLLMDHNMLVRSGNRAAALGFFDLIYENLPRYQRNMILSGSIQRIGLGPLVRGTFIDTSIMDPNRAVRLAIGEAPYRIMVEDATRRLGELFSYAAKGGAFVSSVVKETNAESLPDYLLRFQKVREEDLNCLDLLVDLDGTAIYEYRWLSRAEARGGEAIKDFDMLEVAKVADNGAVAMEELAGSKLFPAIALRKGVSEAEAARAFYEAVA